MAPILKMSVCMRLSCVRVKENGQKLQGEDLFILHLLAYL